MQVDTPFINNERYINLSQSMNNLSSRKTWVDKGKDGDKNNSGMASTLLLMMIMMMLTMFPITQKCENFKGHTQ
jgi:hypothetical protein